MIPHSSPPDFISGDPYCRKCRKPVDQVSINHLVSTECYLILAMCHGEMEMTRIPAEWVQNGGKVALGCWRVFGKNID